MGLKYQNKRSEELLSKVNSLINQNIEALIFDCDGTLVDSMPLHMKAWEIAFNLFNAAYIEDFLNSLKGMKETEIIELYTKPSPDLFLETAKNLNVVPGKCLVFEDGDTGLEAAASAGMKYLDVREYIS
ncbi:MAG: HAD family hydrolase [Candidatus Bathyarchaeota archaeon]